MKAIIPVAGYGTRMRPHTDHIQKTLLPIAGKPTLGHIVEPLLNAGISRINFIIGHLGEQVVEYMKSYEGDFQFIEQKEILGLGHAVLQGMDDTNERLLIQLGDNLFDTDLSQFIAGNHHRIAVGQVEDPRRFGVVELKNDLITQFHEKPENPPSNYAITGLYFFKNQNVIKTAIETLIQRNIRTKNEYQITDAFKIMLEEGEQFEPWECDWLDTGVPDTMLFANKHLLAKIDSAHGLDIKPPVYIGGNVELINSKLGPNVSIMDNCVIKNCEIEDSIVLENTHLSNQSLSHRIAGKDGSEIC